MRLVRASDDDRLEGTRTLNFDNGTSTQKMMAVYPDSIFHHGSSKHLRLRDGDATDV
jgi:hypothetical protein